MKLSLGYLLEMERQAIAGKGAGGGGLVLAMRPTTLLIVSGMLGFSQYSQMASLGQRNYFKLCDSL